MSDLVLPGSKSKWAVRVLGVLAMIAVLLFALALALTSLFASARINPVDYSLLKIELFRENPIVNLLVAVVGIALIALLGKLPVTRRSNLILGGVVLVALGLFGVAWVHSVKAFAESDGDVLIQICERLIAGDYASIAKSGEYLHYYMARFPYQSGFLSYLEVLVRLFGTTGVYSVARLINVGLLVSSYAALLLTTQRLFQNDRVTFVTIVLLCLNLQPVISCTFIYGLIPALTLVIWAIYFVVRYMQTDKKRNMIPVVVLLAVAVYLRSNTWIAIAAIGIVLLLHAIQQKKLAPIFMIIVIIVACMPLPKMAQTFYEQRLDTSFGEGYPKSYWAAMSLQKGWKATGWHVQEYQTMMEQTYGEDVAGIDARARLDVLSGITAFQKDPGTLGTYLFEKMVSQWDEPTFLSIWISKSVNTFGGPTFLARALYSDAFGSLYQLFTGKLIKVMYFGFAICAVVLLFRRTNEQMIFPIIILGGGLFHLIFEAKSQYVLEYLPLMLPLVAYGVFSLGRFVAHLKNAKAASEAKADTLADGGTAA